MVVNSCSGPDAWTPLGKVSFRDNSSVSVLDGQALDQGDRSGDRGLFRHGKAGRVEHLGSTTLKVEKPNSHSRSAIGVWWKGPERPPGAPPGFI